MRPSHFVRLIVCTGLVLALFTSLIATVSAQAATPAATDNGMMAQMMGMQGACPQGMAATLFASMQASMTPEATMASTPAMAMTPEATMNMNMNMSMATPEATAMMGATSEAMSMMGVTCLFGQFSGTAESPAGAPGAMGVVFVSVDPSTGNICYEEAVGGITLPATMEHIHQAPAGQSGNIAVPLDIAPGANGMASGCVTASTTLANQIASNPAGYYVNVHTSDFPNGAARAQLQVWNASMMNGMMTTEPGMMMTAEATTSP